MHRRHFLFAFAGMLLAACGSVPPALRAARGHSERGREAVMFALSLLDTGYRFGGKNPDAGLDCSGMVSYIFDRAAGLRVSGSAADIARQGRPVERHELVPGDLVFFNTLNRPLSHVGLYIGDDRFIHAPSAASGRVRIDRLSSGYFASRFDAGRSYFD
ncbi:C40 family peptidase [Azospira restricta]|uniref:C40 family peptidase n=1 Tax=Azospira restricta TaxID=404405 RepID=A0A974SPK4_9RHOO|nr:C40 family peptidase [Azospira restricta]QRJ64107.1 C40 family peptidase [Azospira restricta]